jgi:hypothetical protein
VYTRGPVSYAAFCSPCRPSLATGSVSDASVVTPKIATNVKPGCTAAELSTDCWHLAASNGLPHEQVSGIAVDPTNPSTIFVSLRQMIVMGADPHVTGDQKVMVSHDGGENFTDLTGDMPRADAHRIVLRNGQLYVATDVGVFTAPAGGTKWERFGTGLPQVTYRSMQLDPSGRYLVAGAYGRGAWVYDFQSRAQSSAHVSPVKTSLSSNRSSSSTTTAGGTANDRHSAAASNRVASATLNSRLASANHRPSTGLVLVAALLLALVASGAATSGYRRVSERRTSGR